MNPEKGKENLNANPSFRESLQKLSDIDNPTPLDPKKIDAAEVRDLLIFSGLDLKSVEANPDLMESISKSKFHNFDSGRGPAVMVALGGSDKSQEYFDWVMEKSVDQPKLSKGDDTSKARGSLQFTADTIAFATGTLTAERYAQKTNWRVGKKYQKDPEIAKRFNLPTDEGGLQKLKETSSIPKGFPVEALQKIVSLNK